MPERVIQNRQRQVRIVIAGLEQFCAKARKELGLAPASFSVLLVNSAQISRWNSTYRGKPRPTDVLSFPSDSSNGRRHRFRRERYLGDIAICPAVARRNAAQFARTLHQELCVLLLHGVLHLIGYDHETDTGQMDRREKLLRKKLGLG